MVSAYKTQLRSGVLNFFMRSFLIYTLLIYIYTELHLLYQGVYQYLFMQKHDF